MPSTERIKRKKADELKNEAKRMKTLDSLW